MKINQNKSQVYDNNNRKLNTSNSNNLNNSNNLSTDRIQYYNNK